MRSAGYLEIFEERYDVEAQDLNQQGGGRLKCHSCGKLHEDWKITIETISPFRTEDICEDCLINSKNRKIENTKKKKKGSAAEREQSKPAEKKEDFKHSTGRRGLSN